MEKNEQQQTHNQAAPTRNALPWPLITQALGTLSLPIYDAPSARRKTREPARRSVTFDGTKAVIIASVPFHLLPRGKPESWRAD